MRLIDGKAIAGQIKDEVSAAVAELKAHDVEPTLAIVNPTDDDAASWYVRSLRRAAEIFGITCTVDQLTDPTVDQLTDRLAALSTDRDVHGVICQTPLPAGVRPGHVTSRIVAAKDVDGANPQTLGHLAAGIPAFPPATAAAVLRILHHERVPIAGARAVVVGRSLTIGKPAALMLLQQDATVTICHSHTADLLQACRQADILIVATGKPDMITSEFIKPGATVIDVGTNPTPDGGLIGDVATNTLHDTDAAVTPVPGGVGPVTTMTLMQHTATAAAKHAAAGKRLNIIAPNSLAREPQ